MAFSRSRELMKDPGQGVYLNGATENITVESQSLAGCSWKMDVRRQGGHDDQISHRTGENSIDLEDVNARPWRTGLGPHHL